MNNEVWAHPASQDRAFAATPSSPQAVSPVPASIPLRGAAMSWAKLFDLLDRAEWTIEEIADAYGVTRKRVKALIRVERGGTS